MESAALSPYCSEPAPARWNRRPIIIPRSSSLAIADLGNGRQDIVVANGNLGVLMGNGDGTFQNAATTFTGTPIESLAVADFGAGRPDIAVDYTDPEAIGLYSPATQDFAASLTQTGPASATAGGASHLKENLTFIANPGVIPGDVNAKILLSR